MEGIVKKIIARLFPELTAGYHLPRYAKVVNVADAPKGGEISTDFRPYYAVDLRLLDHNLKPATDGVIYEAVPLPIPAGSDEQGQYGFPKPNTIVVLMFAYGSPSHPVITAILPHDRLLPSVPENELLWQSTNETFLRATSGENWRLIARNKLNVGNGSINLLSEVRDLAGQVNSLSNAMQSHIHPESHGNTGAPTNSGTIGNVGAATLVIKDNVSTITE